MINKNQPTRSVVVIDDENHVALKVRAAKKGATMSDIANQAIRQYLAGTNQTNKTNKKGNENECESNGV